MHCRGGPRSASATARSLKKMTAGDLTVAGLSAVIRPPLQLLDSSFSATVSSNPSASYLLLQPAGEYFQKKIDETEDDRAKECREKALDAEAGDKSRGQFQHERINHKPEYAKAQKRKRKCHDFQKQTDGGIHQSDHKRGDQGRAEAGDIKASNDVSDDHQAESAQQPVY